MPQHKYRTILLFGPPGVGKGTQGKVLGGLPGFRHISSGDFFRALDPESANAKEAQSYIERGELVPDELTIRVWKEVMEHLDSNGDFNSQTDMLILDGIPRSIAQADALSEYIDVVCLLALVTFNEEAMVQRIKRRALESGRPDDADETVIRHRFNVYRRETEPVLKYYSDDVKHQIDALQSPAEVLHSILNCVIPALPAPVESAAG